MLQSSVAKARWEPLLLIGLVVAFSMLVAPCALAKAAPSVQQKQKELRGIQSQISRQRSKVSNIKRQESSVVNQLVRTEHDLQNTRARLDSLQGQRGRTEADIAGTAAELRVALAELDKAERKLQTQRDGLRRRLRAIYKRGAGSYLDMMLTSQDFGDFVTRFDLLERIVNQDVDLIKQVKAQKAIVDQQRQRIADRKATLEKRRAVLVGIAANVAREQVRISSRVKERAAYLQQIQSQRALEEQVLDSEEAAARQLDGVIAKLLAAHKGEVTLTDTGRMSWPASGPITSPYGWRYHPIYHVNKFHSGIDIGVPYGTPVGAAKAGVVRLASWYGSYGNCVIIDHGSGITTTYAHNSRILVSVGQKVSRGQTVARAGATGAATGNHVHFEVRVNGATKDPMAWLAGR